MIDNVKVPATQPRGAVLRGGATCFEGTDKTAESGGGISRKTAAVTSGRTYLYDLV